MNLLAIVAGAISLILLASDEPTPYAALQRRIALFVFCFALGMLVSATIVQGLL